MVYHPRILTNSDRYLVYFRSVVKSRGARILLIIILVSSKCQRDTFTYAILVARSKFPQQCIDLRKNCFGPQLLQDHALLLVAFYTG